MRLTVVLALLAAGSAWACAPGGPPSPPGLSYDLPEDPTLTYAWGDTSRLEMSLSGQDFDASSAASAMVDATFTRIEGGLQASFTFDDFQGRFSQPMGSPSRASADDVTGPLFFDLDRRGKVSSVRPPQLEGSAAQVLEPYSLAHGFFPILPGTAAEPGDIWTDTLRYDVDSDWGTVEATVVRRYTLEGDTVADGRSLLLIRSAGTADVATDGEIQRMRVSQSASGSLEGTHLWDPGRGILVASRETPDLRGTLRASAAPAPLNLRVRQTIAIRLTDGG